MPLYEFQCTDCKDDFEELVRSSAAVAEVKCPHCGGEHVQAEGLALCVEGRFEQHVARPRTGRCVLLHGRNLRASLTGWPCASNTRMICSGSGDVPSRLFSCVWIRRHFHVTTVLELLCSDRKHPVLSHTTPTTRSQVLHIYAVC